MNRIDGEGVDVISPPSPSVAPPGYYMLFLLDGQGVPSVASWVRIDPTAPDRPTIGPAPNAPPSPQIIMPAAAAGFMAGEQLEFSGLATDPEDGIVPASGLSWRLRGSNCPGHDCAAELTPPASGGSGLFLAPSEPLSAARTLKLTATDSEGASSVTKVQIQPRLATLTIKSRFDGARVSVAHRRGRTPFNFAVLGGAAVRIGTPARQHAHGHSRRVKLKWRRWSDGGERVHTVSPTEDARYRVGFELRRPRHR